MQYKFVKLLKIFLVVMSLDCLAACAVPSSGPEDVSDRIIWSVDSLTNIGGHSVEVMGNPRVVKTDVGAAVLFDGDGDRLLVNHNPLFGAEEFTIEIIFNPNDVYPQNAEPRFFHIESDESPDRRITIELRLNDQHQWYLDTFVKSDVSKYTLIDATLIHPIAVWTHAAITYKDTEFTSYVNGQRELSANVEYQPIPESAKSSIGARMNQVHWFNGAISHIAITHKAVEPKEFVLLDKLP